MTSEDLQKRIERSLHRRLSGCVSLEYKLTWKHWDMQWGPAIYARRAFPHRTSAKGYGGWPTTDAQAMNVGCDPEKHLRRLKRLARKWKNGNGAGLTLGAAAAVAGWPTCLARDHQGDEVTEESIARSKLPVTAKIAGYPTPQASDFNGSSPRPRLKGDQNRDPSMPGSYRKDLRDLPHMISGKTTSGSRAETEGRGALNPDLARWLMGYPEEWGYSGAMAMQSFLK